MRQFFRSPSGIHALIIIISALVCNSCVSSKSGGDIYGGFGQASSSIPLNGAVRTGKLPNGLSFYILKNTMPENRIFLSLAVHAGSVNEEENERGLAHFVEHMLFEGTEHYPHGELRGYLRSLGMRYGADQNAYTSHDETVYRLEVPSEIDAAGVKRVPEGALAILDDWTRAVTFDPADIEKERGVVLEELRYRSGVGNRNMQRLYAALLEGSIYADRFPIGLPEIIETAGPELLRGFYQKWYCPENMAIILVGDFDDEALEAEIVSHFNAPAPESSAPVPPDTAIPPPVKNSIRVELITDPEQPYATIYAYYKREGRERGKDLAWYRETLMQDLIESMLSLRFGEASDDPETPYMSASSWEQRHGASGRFFTLAAVSKPGLVKESLRALITEKESILKYGFTESEIVLAKRSLISVLRRALSEQGRQNSRSFLLTLDEYFLRGGNAADAEWRLAAAESLLPGIGSRELALAGKSLFAANDLTLVITAPETEAENIPAEAEARRIIAETARARIARPAEKPITEELLDQTPEPGTILSTEEDEKTGVFILTLSNGATVILQSTANKNNEIVMYAISRGGYASAPEAEAVSARLASDLMEMSGLGPYNHSELIQRITGKQVSLEFWSTSMTRGFSGSSTREDIKTFFELLWLGFSEARIDEEAARVLADQYRTLLVQNDENPERFFFDEINRIVSGNNRWLRPLALEDVDKINREEALRFLNLASNPADYIFVFTGNMDPAFMSPFLETYLASIPARELSLNTFGSTGVVRPAKSEHRVYKGREAKSLVFLSWYRSRAFSLQLDVAASVLSEYLDIVLTEEIREKLGEAYTLSAGAHLSLIPEPGELSFTTYFGCNPERALELSDLVIREVEAVARGRINPEYFARAVESLQKTLEESLQNNRYIAQRYANYYALLKAPLAEALNLPARYGAIRPADLQNLCAELLPSGPARIILYPETMER